MAPSSTPRTLRWHLFRLTLIGLVPLAVFAALALLQAARGQRAELARSTLDLARAVASAVQAELDGTVMTLASLSRSSDLQAGDISAFYQRTQRLMELQPEWTSMVLADSQGRVLFRTSLPLERGPVAPVDRDSLASTLESARPTVGQAMRGPRGHVTVAVRYPVLRDGRTDFVLTAVLRPDRLLDILRRQQVPENWVIAILDARLRIFARSQAQEQFALREATPELQALASAGRRDGTGISRNQEGARVVTGFSRTPEFDWLVAVGAPSPPLAQLLSPTVGLYFAGAVGSLLICALLALRAARRISADIQRVSDSAARLGEGRPAGPLEPAGSRIVEIEQLARALDDASQRLHAAQAAQATALQQAQEAGRAKDEFLAILGHELRNPLAPMVSAMYLLDARSTRETERERGILRRQMDHLRSLVDDLLDVARLTRGKVTIEHQPVELVRELSAVLEDVRQASDSDTDTDAIRFEPEEAQAWVRGDSRRLAQVFTNLLTNALRHGQGQPVTVSLRMAGSQVHVRVQDSGEGMEAQTLAHVFEPFYQSHLAPGRQRVGLGLGLAIVRSLVEAHGGTVSAHSAGPGQGARFDVLLPAAEPPAPSSTS
ncbi:sensor histidine kinase [Ramlibacter sp. AW1]|uniref:histidine kinase n=1 Tax=Ramlibacter aurantiacus TaxID=2801330 RepID=A0A936ZQS0_9BURK|nr:sensor histidine kinase [Ramlibacter aurantiacus]MBL0421758.1 sensor histidine kinase [Ramlibacter aurantiacus]